MTDLETIIEAKKRRIFSIEAENDEVYDTIREAAKGFQMDTTGVRITLLINHLKKAGVMSEEQWVDYDLDLAMTVKEALAGPLAQLQDAQRHGKLSVPKQGPRLVDGNGRPLT